MASTLTENNKKQFDRIYRLVVGDSKGTALVIDNLQMEFSIRKVAGNTKKSNTCQIKLYNLSKSNLNLLQDKDFANAQFSVGYADTGLIDAFSGNVVEIETEKNGVDRVTTLTIDSGYANLNFVSVSKQLPSGSTVEQVVETLRKAMPGVAKGVYAGTRIKTALPYGYPVSGTPRRVLDALCKAYNLEYRIDQDILYVNDMENVIENNLNTVFVMSKESGLLSAPYYKLGRMSRGKKDPLRTSGTTFTALINFAIKPGSAIKLVYEEEKFEQVLKVDSVSYSGSWRGNDWQMEVECVDIPESVKRAAARAIKKKESKDNE